MSPYQHAIGYVRPDARISEREQRRAVTTSGALRVTGDWSTVMRSRRKDATADVVIVKRLHLLADPSKLRARGGMRQSMLDRLAALRSRGTEVIEADTGRSTGVAGQYEAMLADATATLAQSRERSKRIGRRPIEYSEDALAVMRLHWRSMDHRTNGHALAAMASDGVRVSAQKAARLLGPSGRKPGTRKD